MRIWGYDEKNLKVHPQNCPCCNGTELNIGIRGEPGQGGGHDYLYIQCRKWSCGLMISREASRDKKRNEATLVDMIRDWNRLSAQERKTEPPERSNDLGRRFGL